MIQAKDASLPLSRSTFKNPPLLSIHHDIRMFRVMIMFASCFTIVHKTLTLGHNCSIWSSTSGKSTLCYFTAPVTRRDVLVLALCVSPVRIPTCKIVLQLEVHGKILLQYEFQCKILICNEGGGTPIRTLHPGPWTPPYIPRHNALIGVPSLQKM